MVVLCVLLMCCVVLVAESAVKKATAAKAEAEKVVYTRSGGTYVVLHRLSHAGSRIAYSMDAVYKLMQTCVSPASIQHKLVLDVESMKFEVIF